MGANGRLRPDWKRLIRNLTNLGPTELHRRTLQARRTLHESGVAYNPHDEIGSGARPGDLELLPLTIAAEDWTRLEKGLEQRARLLDLMLADLYGPQRLLKEKLVPPQLLYCHPGYRPVFHGLGSGTGGLTLAASDIIRTANGDWRVTADRTRAPAGLGHVLETRIVTSRMLPRIFADANVVRLARFFIALRENLQALAPRNRDNPRIVLWSRGAETSSYFEDAYLARYLNFTLAESGDLAVREDGLHLKTLGGLLPTEVVLRRTNDELTDPVELDAGGGVCGLLEAARSGQTALANRPGSRILESPAWLPFMPAICRFLLSEELLLPAIETHWCGDDANLEWTMANLDRIIIRHAYRFGPDSRRAIDPKQLTATDRDVFLDRLRQAPGYYVAQLWEPGSVAPSLTPEGMRPWHVQLRCYVTGNGQKYTVMPGAMAAAAPDPLALTDGAAGAQGTRDVWVIGDAPVEVISLLPSSRSDTRLRRSGTELPSRVAENLFWLGRHLERLDSNARLVRAAVRRLGAEHEFAPDELTCLMNLLRAKRCISAAAAKTDHTELLPVLRSVVTGTTRPSNLAAEATELCRLAATVRDRLSLDTWDLIRGVEAWIAEGPRQSAELESIDLLAHIQRLLTLLSAIAGVAHERMTRTLGWRFLDMGRRLESAWHSAELLGGSLLEPAEHEDRVLEVLLETTDCVMTYRSRYLADLQTVPVIDLLVTDSTNPRSMEYQLTILHEHVQQLPHDPSKAGRTADERLALALLNDVLLADAAVLSQEEDGTRPKLAALVTRLLDRLPKLSQAISARYLIHGGMPRHFELLGEDRE